MEEIRQLFEEMDALGMLYPKNGKTAITALYVQWRDEHWKYWFEKWYYLHSRKGT
jgi:hypothetical protein